MSQYTRNPPLLETDLLADPAAQLRRWLGDADAAGMMEPNAMTLASVDENGRPSARVVLFKGFDGAHPTFYTDYRGRKGRELAHNPQVGLVFWWDRLERQARIEGRAEKLPREVSEAYFRSRPRESQLGALVSRQSQVVASRELLDERLAELERRYQGQPLPCPEHWGGYRIVADAWEFWQGRLARLHDRLRYRREGGNWTIERLEP